jgi:anti-sigma factor RsiW
MHPVDDNELILFHYRDGLDARRLSEVETALASSAELRARYASLRALLDRADVEAPVPDAGFEQRVWADFERRLATRPVASTGPGWVGRLLGLLRGDVGFVPAFGALAAVCVVTLAIGFLVGRGSVPPSVPTVEAPSVAPTMASRVLDSYVAGHLRATEGVLMTAANSAGSNWQSGNRELAESLVESNRLYAAAAARAGNLRLADFLRQLEPVLIDVANQTDSYTVEDRQGLRDFLRDTDLLFQVRATESRIEAETRRSL